jgi:hemoglobin
MKNNGFKALSGIASALLALGATGAVSAQDTAPAPPPSAATAPVIATDDKLFNEFGGKAGLVTLMDDFMDTLMKDERTRPFFEPVDRVKVKALLVEQVCHILNGGCAYTGRDMALTHAKLGIKQEDFYALVEDLQIAMDKNRIPFSAQNKLLAALAPQSRDIVYKEPAK